MTRPDPASRRVLITTVPFGQYDRRPIEMLEAEGIDYVINPIGRRLTAAELQEMICGFGVLIAGTEPITADVVQAAARLQCIVRVGIGLDNVALAETRARGITVCYTPDAPSPAVAELTIGLMLSLLRDIAGADRRLRSGVWHRVPGRRLAEMTVGVIGVGRIGRRVIQHLRGGFPGVRLLANDLDPDLEFGRAHGVDWVAKETLYGAADVISLHLPLTPQTRRLITRREIDLMNPDVVLINTSRGNMIDERDLAAALRDGRIAGAALDVFEQEPYVGELTSFDRCLLTCHMGSMSRDCRTQMEIEAVDEALRFLRGAPLGRRVPDHEYASGGAP